jgi:hypothetical protein
MADERHISEMSTEEYRRELVHWGASEQEAAEAAEQLREIRDRS